MSSIGSLYWSWLIHTLMAGGGLLLLASSSILIIQQPARRRQIGAWAVQAALLVPLLALAPAWWHVTIPAASSSVSRTPISPPTAPPLALADATGVPQSAPEPYFLAFVPVLPAAPIAAHEATFPQ